MRSGFFDNTEVISEDFARFAAGILTNGVLADTESALRVSAGQNMTVGISPGYAWINGHFGVAENAEALTLQTADGTYGRKDRIIVRMNMSEGSVYLHVLTGNAGETPAAPNVVRDGTYYDLSLAVVSIPAGTLQITDAMIEDTRRDTAVCGGVYPSLSGAFVWPSANNIADIKLTAASSAPDKWLLCNGAAVSRTKYADLFSVIGTTYGSGDGSTTFNLPDLSDRLPLGKSSYKNLGQTGGEDTHTLTISEMPSHTHTVSGSVTIPNGTAAGAANVKYTLYSQNANAGDSAFTVTGTAAARGGGNAFPIMPPYVVLNYIIFAGV